MGSSLYDPVIRDSVVGISGFWDLVHDKFLILVLNQKSTSFTIITVTSVTTDARVTTVSNSCNKTWTKEGIFMTNLILFSSTTLK